MIEKTKNRLLLPWMEPLTVIIVATRRSVPPFPMARISSFLCVCFLKLFKCIRREPDGPTKHLGIIPKLPKDVNDLSIQIVNDLNGCRSLCQS